MPQLNTVTSLDVRRPSRSGPLLPHRTSTREASGGGGEHPNSSDETQQFDQGSTDDDNIMDDVQLHLKAHRWHNKLLKLKAQPKQRYSALKASIASHLNEESVEDNFFQLGAQHTLPDRPPLFHRKTMESAVPATPQSPVRRLLPKLPG